MPSLFARVAQTFLEMHPLVTQSVELVDYLHRETLSSPVVESLALEGIITAYSEKIITEHLGLSTEVSRILRDDRELRLATSVVTWIPTLAGSVRRANTTLWRVMELAGGPGYPFWRLRIRKIPGQD